MWITRCIIRPNRNICGFWTRHTAAKFVFPSIKIRACQLHLGQNWRKKFKIYFFNLKQTQKMARFWSTFLTCPFQIQKISMTVLLKISWAFCLEAKRIAMFIDYIFDNYISNEALFPPVIWTTFSTTTNRKTNNCRPFHAKLNGSFHTSHPTIYNFVTVLKEIQYDVYIKIRITEGRKETKKYSGERNISQRTNGKIINNSISRFNFVKSLSCKFLPNWRKLLETKQNYVFLVATCIKKKQFLGVHAVNLLVVSPS